MCLASSRRCESSDDEAEGARRIVGDAAAKAGRTKPLGELPWELAAPLAAGGAKPRGEPAVSHGGGTFALTAYDFFELSILWEEESERATLSAPQLLEYMRGKGGRLESRDACPARSTRVSLDARAPSERDSHTSSVMTACPPAVARVSMRRSARE